MMKICEIVIPFPRKKNKDSFVNDAISEYYLVDLNTGKVLDIKPTKKEADLEKSKLERWHKLSVGIQEV